MIKCCVAEKGLKILNVGEGESETAFLKKLGLGSWQRSREAERAVMM